MDVGSMSISGLVSDLDINGIITQLGQIRRRPVELLEQRQAAWTEKLTAFQQLSARLLGLSTACTALCDGSSFRQVTASSSDASAVVVGASAGAPVGHYDVTVQQLARAHKISSGTITSCDEALGLTGEILLGGEVINIEATDTLEDIRDAINAAAAGASASILSVSDTDHRLVITSLTSGADGALDLVDANASNLLEALGLQTNVTSVKHTITNGAAGDRLADKLTAVGEVLGLSSPPAGTVQVNGADVTIDLSSDSLQDIADAIDTVEGVSATVVTETVDGQTQYRLEIVGDTGTPTLVDDGNVLVTLGVLQKTIAHEVDAAQDSVFTIDGVTMTRSTNAVDDAIENVQLQLLQETTDAVTITIERDTEATVSAIEDFVSYYNKTVELINANQDFDVYTEEGGAFFGSPVILNLEADLRRQVSALVDTMGGDLKLASQIGVTTGTDDQLVFDAAAFRAALEADPVGVERLFGVVTEASNAEIEVLDYTSATRDSGSAGYAIEITQVATRPTALSTSLPGGIVADETLTINGKQVTLSAGMSLQDAADLLNSLFTAQNMSLSASVEGDRLQIVHDVWGDSHQIAISSSLDDGVGGTDLGGATAGEIATYVGQDVAGTINGEPATGRGRLLTGAEGTDVEGLQLRVTSTTTGGKGVVRISKGIAARMRDFVEAATDPDTGAVTRAAEGITTEIEAIDEQIAEIEAEVERYIKQLQSDFAVMETRMSQSTALLDWMQLQVEHLAGWQNDD